MRTSALTDRLRVLLAKHGPEIARRQALVSAGASSKSARAGVVALMQDLGLSQHDAGELIGWVREHGYEAATSPAAPAPPPPQETETPEPPAPEQPEVDVRAADEDSLHVSAKGQGLVRNLDDLYDLAEIDRAVWTADGFQARTWATPVKRQRYGPEGVRVDDDVVIIRSWYVSAKFRKRLDAGVTFPKWVPTPRLDRPEGRAVACALILPDMQGGYRWADRHRRLLPLHDWAALDVALQLAQILDPEVVQLLGDNLDLAPFGKYDVTNDLRETTRPTLLSMHAYLRRLRSAAPSADVDYQGGNHDRRSESALHRAGLEEAQGLAPATDDDGSPGALHFARLLGLDELGITYRDYGGERWLWNAIRIHHGELVRNGGGKTVAAAIGQAHYSEVFGHIHRAEIAHRTVHGPRGRRTIAAASPGCLCHVDGRVPGVNARPDWQQGIGIAWWDEGRQQEHIEVLPIHDGVLVWRGQRIEGDADRLADEIGAEIGWDQVRPGRTAA